MKKYTDINEAHKRLPNAKALAFQTEVRNRIENNDRFEWGDELVWIEVAKKWSSVRGIATVTPFRPSDSWLMEDGTTVSADTAKGKMLGTVNQCTIVVPPPVTGELDDPEKKLASGRGRGRGRGGYRGVTGRDGQNGQGGRGMKAPCERFNMGRCQYSAEACRSGHYCAQYRNDVGRGCGPAFQHPFNTHQQQGRPDFIYIPI
jgi:hypothetical protein